MKKNDFTPGTRAAFKIAVIYLIFSILWILFSDQAVLFFFTESEDMTRIQTIKGWGFIFTTAVLIFLMLQKEITRRLQTQKAFAATEEKYRMLVDRTPDMLYRTDLDGRITFISPSVSALSGYTVEEAIGLKMAEEVYLVPEEREMFLQILSREGKVNNFEARLKRKDGSIWWASTNAHFFKDKTGTILGVEGITRDISDKKAGEQTILANEQRLKAILEATPDPMVLYDMDGHPLYINPAFTTVFGWTLELLKGQTIPYVPEDQKQVTDEKIREIYATGNPLSFETRRRTKSGKPLDVILSAAVSKNEDKSPSGLVVILKDISEKKHLASQLEQAQKMEALGTLAGGIAHDFNNLLSGIYGYMDLARRHTTDEKTAEFLSRAIDSSERARNLTRQLLTFAKGGAPVTRVGALKKFLEESTRFALSGADVSCSFDLPDDLWTCYYDKNQMGQVIDNIVINANHAMPSGGNIHVAAANVDIKKSDQTDDEPEKFVKISVSDTGTGIPQKYIKRIFDPFFSTKHTGSGLGLATAYSIVKRHGGWIDVDSEPGDGSVFHLFLPATGQTYAEESKKTPSDFHGSGKILVMDDEPSIREMVTAMLIKMGFSSVSVSDGKTAVEAFKTAVAEEKPFSAVILDLTIPGGMGGKETVKLLRDLDPDIPIFVASGYSEDAAISDPLSFGFTASIEKPFTIAQLAHVLKTHSSRGTPSSEPVSQ